MMRFDSLSANFFEKAIKDYEFFVLTFPRLEFRHNGETVAIEGICWVVIHPTPEMLSIVGRMTPLGNPRLGILKHPSFYESEEPVLNAEELQRIEQSLDTVALPVIYNLDGDVLFNSNKDF